MMADPVFRKDIGVRNPFAVAEIKLGKSIDWKQSSPEKIRKLLAKAHNAPYNDIFSASNTHPGFLHPIKSGSGDATTCTSESVKKYIANWGTNRWGGCYDVPAGTCGAYDDPVQGALSDCFFIAALSSIASASTTRTRFFQDMTTFPVNISFYDGFVVTNGVSIPTTKTTISVNNSHLPLGQNGNLVFGRSNTPSENWIALYEKAYAMWKCGITSDNPPAEPDYSKMCFGNPITALANITNLKYSNDSTFSTASLTADDIFTKIANVACDSGSKLLPNDRKAKYPAVAFTYDSADPGYSNPAIVRNHSYSILGVCGNDKSELTKDHYIVLRNPWGQVPPSCLVDPNILNSQRCILDAAGKPIICYGDPNPDSSLGSETMANKSWFGLNLADPSDGIFGLRVESFKKYFQGFGWVFG